MALALPVSASANLTGTPTLAANTALSLDTGATSSAGGDILWSGSSMTPEGKAAAFNLGALGSAGFGSLTQSILSAFPGYSSAAIPASTLVVNDVFAVKTNGGNYAAVLVTAVSGTSITLQFTTFGVSGAPSGPSITAVQNNYSEIPAGFSNSGIAQGALFVVIGSGLADPNAQAVLQSSAGSGLPNTLNGASVKVTVNGTTTVPVFYYAIAGALGLVLPSATPTGTGQITVTYNGQTSSPYTIQVVASAMGFDAYYGTGSGLGVATNSATGVLYNYNNSIPPGTTVTLWGSGLGADPARDSKYVPAAFAINSLAHVYIGGIDAPILYQGASGFPGLNQVNVTVPSSVPAGCNLSLVGVTAAGLPTNFTTLPIGTGPCSDPAFGLAGATLQTLSGQSTVKTGFVALYQSTSPAATGTTPQVSDLALAVFQSHTGSSYAISSGSVSLGGCIVSQTLSATATNGTTTALDAGTITVTGPTGNATLTTVPQLTGYYEAQLASNFIPTSGGSFSFQGSGGKDVGSFNAPVVFSNPILTWTNQGAAATVTRSAGQLVTWTGGASGTFVAITGSSSSVNPAAFGSFTCFVPTSAGQFTVPNYVLAAMPAGSGSLTVANYSNFQTFSASGLDYGISYGFVISSINPTYQ
jgi:uncharacterized protein (TIGR03437 family)